jgi:hypothetical protein
MSHGDRLLRADLELVVPPPTRSADWDDVVRRAATRSRVRRGAAVLALAAATLALGTVALAETLGHGFSDWLEGRPGTAASSEDEERFRERNERSLAPLAAEADLRELQRVEHERRTYRLLGFRTGGAVCLRLEGTDIDEGGDVACVSADELEESQDLAVPLKVDAPLHETAPGDPPSDVATFGLVAAEARRVVLVGDDGERDANVANGSFLSITPGPIREHTTLEGFVIDDRGIRLRIPLAPALGPEIDFFRTGLPVRGPGAVERVVRSGRIRWLERREPRGDAFPEAVRRRAGEFPPGSFARIVTAPGAFARMIHPDPNDFVRVLIGIPRKSSAEICYGEVTRGGTGGGCSAAARLFAELPFTAGWTYSGVGSQFVTAAGIATDEVARLELFLGNGERREVALRDNAFVVRAARAKFPARIVAYDAAGRVIGVHTSRGS